MSATPRLGGSTFSFMWQEPALATMRRMRAVGLREFDVLTVPGHLWPDELSAAARSELAQAMRREDVRIESLNLPALDVNLASCAPAVRDFAVELYAATLRLSAELGGRGVVVVPGRISALLPPALDDSLRWLEDGIERLLRIADAAGQRLFIETHPQTPIPTAEAAARVLARFGHPRLLVAYDVANAEFIGEDQPAALRRLQPWLGQVHLSDATRTSWRHDRAGLGTVDFPLVLAALDEIGFEGVCVVEVISADAMADIEVTMDLLCGPASP